MVKIDRSGSNRIVILTHRYAIKIARAHSLRAFLYGLLNNLNEARDSRLAGRCPVVFSLGFLVVMRRAERVTEWDREKARRLCEECRIRAELKPESFGLLNGELVVIDYGWEMP